MNKKAIALYFPQFHSIPENDEWWGKGFTDWDNVRSGNPLFKGHRQPRVPLNNNYYDLSSLTAIQWQVDLAKKYGIYGFAIYHYWFDGKLLIEKPKELLLKHPEIDFPFCLTWANETWARRWDGNDKTVLQLQTHEPSIEKWKNHFEYLLPYFKDKRAIRIDDKVLFQIYRPHLIPKIGEMLSYWRELARKNGVGELYFNAIKSFDFPDNSILNEFDGVLLFQPAEVTNSKDVKGSKVFIENMLRHCPEFLIEWMRALRTKTKKSYTRYDYDEIVRFAEKRRFERQDLDYFNMAFMEWDNTARYHERATLYDGCTPKKFKKFLTNLFDVAEIHGHDKFVFINAWNEWAEGTYLEPDTHYKYQYLEAVREIVSNN